MWYRISFFTFQLFNREMCKHFSWCHVFVLRPFVWPSMPLLWGVMTFLKIARSSMCYLQAVSDVSSNPLKFNIIDCYHFMKLHYESTREHTYTKHELNTDFKALIIICTIGFEITHNYLFNINAFIYANETTCAQAFEMCIRLCMSIAQRAF